MKIVYLMTELGMTGGSLVIYNFIENLSIRGHEVYIVTPENYLKWEIGTKDKIIKSRAKSKCYDNNIMKYLKNNILTSLGLKSLKVKITSSDYWFYHRYLPKITTKLEKNFNLYIKNADVLISTHSLTAFAGHILSDKVKNSFYHMQHYEELLFINSELKRKFIRATYFLPFNLISNSIWLKNIIKNICNRDSILINPGIDHSIYKPYIDPEQKYLNNKEKFTILSFVDAYRKHKGSEDLSNALKIIRREFGSDKVRIMFFGFGMSKDFPNFPKENIQYLGYVSPMELPHFYSMADVFVLPSWYESFPLQPIEAMACGTVVITTKFGTEDYAINNVNSLVVLPRNPNELAKKTIHALRNMRECLSISQNALKTVKKFCWDEQTNKLEQALLNSEQPSTSSKLTYLTENLINGKNIDKINSLIDNLLNN